MRVLHIAQSPHTAQPGAPQMPQQRMVNLSAYGRPGGGLSFSWAPGPCACKCDSRTTPCIWGARYGSCTLCYTFTS